MHESIDLPLKKYIVASITILATKSKGTTWVGLSGSDSVERDAKFELTDTTATNPISSAFFSAFSNRSEANWGKLCKSFIDLADFVFFVPTNCLFKSYKSLTERRIFRPSSGRTARKRDFVCFILWSKSSHLVPQNRLNHLRFKPTHVRPECNQLKHPSKRGKSTQKLSLVFDWSTRPLAT